MCFPTRILNNIIEVINFIGLEKKKGFVVSENQCILPILSRRLFSLGSVGRWREADGKSPTAQSVRDCVSNPCQDVGMILGNPYRINQVSWQLRLLTGSFAASEKNMVWPVWGE